MRYVLVLATLAAADPAAAPAQKRTAVPNESAALETVVVTCTARPAFKRALDAQMGDFSAAA